MTTLGIWKKGEHIKTPLEAANAAARENHSWLTQGYLATRTYTKTTAPYGGTFYQVYHYKNLPKAIIGEAIVKL
jgi:hypothetical protein